jgi:tetratricopeptide (TPR) repeat protein
LARDTLLAMSRSLLALLVCSSLALAPLTALAQTSDESTDAEAHALFEAARTAFSGGRFADALEHFQSAYDLSHRAALLYNIGQCHDRLRHDAEAIAAFEGYLAGVPDAPQRAEIMGRLAILREAMSHTTTTVAPPPEETHETLTADPDAPAEPEAVAPQPVPPAPSGPGAMPWVLVGLGGAVAIVGAVLVGVAFGDISTVEHAPDGVRYATVREADQAAPILSGVGWASLGVGVAVAVVGVAWAVAGSGSSGESAVLRIGPTGASIQGSF